MAGSSGEADADSHGANGAASNGGHSGGSEAESVKLFVGQVPRHLTEEQLLAMFREVALVEEATVIKDKATKQPRGCCFLICPSREEADKAIAAYHNKRTLSGAASPLQVKYAVGELERLEHKLFIGMLPKNVTDAELIDLFSQYGNIKELQILRGSLHTSKAGCAFLKYDTKEQAAAAIEALNSKHKMEGSTVPLVVKWADTEKERQARKASRAQPHPPPTGINAVHWNGPVPMGFPPQYNGFGYQAPAPYGVFPFPFSAMQNQGGFQNMVPPVSQGNALPGLRPEVPVGPVPRSPIGTLYPPMRSPGFPGAAMNGSHPLRTSHMLPGAPSPNAHSTALPNGGAAGSSGHLEGPPGANLFIYHIPQDYGDQDLAAAFQSFGRVLSAKVYIDKATGVSKCFGFVSYDSPPAAQAAITMMNGFQLGGKKLKVQLKRDNNNKQSNSY